MTISRDLNSKIESLVNRLRRRQVVGSLSVLLETALLLRQVISATRWNQVGTLIKLVKDVGRRLVLAQPRVTDGGVDGIGSKQSFSQVMEDEEEDDDDEIKTKSIFQPKRIIDSQEMQEIISELENMYNNIADQAMENIHSNEIIMTIVKSRTVEYFLCSKETKI
ncbi:hypothetical protein Glove_319g115 [Diversispora epigaea]|uniref:Translation initiation factor eIF2B subunit beta n=1 Tax=Diversispora epigaea TaxID=1348612 RepID=A0A397HWZ5_9GLOM|nr:hypothetical protein Glove_319g115 [Diversispora epigaea]